MSGSASRSISPLSHWPAVVRILILGGTGEARELAAEPGRPDAAQALAANAARVLESLVTTRPAG